MCNGHGGKQCGPGSRLRRRVGDVGPAQCQKPRSHWKWNVWHGCVRKDTQLGSCVLNCCAVDRSAGLPDGKRVAIKRVAFAEVHVARFVYREIRILSSLGHPCLLTLYDLYVMGTKVYIVGKLGEQTLKTLIETNHAALTTVNLLYILYQLTCGINVPSLLHRRRPLLTQNPLIAHAFRRHLPSRLEAGECVFESEHFSPSGVIIMVSIPSFAHFAPMHRSVTLARRAPRATGRRRTSRRVSIDHRR